MRKSFAVAAALTLVVTLSAPAASAASRPQQQKTTAAAKSKEPSGPTESITTIVRRIFKKFNPIEGLDDIWPTIPNP